MPTRGSSGAQRSVSAAGAVPKSLLPTAPVKICVVSAVPGEQPTFVVTSTWISVALGAALVHFPPIAPARRPSSTSVTFCWNGRSPRTPFTHAPIVAPEWSGLATMSGISESCFDGLPCQDR